MTQIYDDYDIVSGLEIHVELLTKTKLFCACSTSFGEKPNSNTCPVCAGLPGSLPVLNREAVKMAMKLGLALNSQIADETWFDRKNYFYPDNPQNYQISQLNAPICKGGWLEIKTANGEKRIGLTQMHLEDDAGKLIHEDHRTLIDYNRSGVALIEIVTEPDFASSDEVIEFLKSLIEILKELEICDCKMQEGSLRVDVNISVSKKGSSELGVRSEIKNINSFTEIKNAMEFEKRRQVDALEEGRILQQETRGWSEKKKSSFFMRYKENERDYRYFPEPDIPVLKIFSEEIDEIRKNLPMLPKERKAFLKDKYKISEKETEFLYKDRHLLALFERTVSINDNPRLTLKWLQGECAYLTDIKNISYEDVVLNPESFAVLMQLAEERSITLQTAKEILAQLFERDFDVIRHVAENNLSINSDADVLMQTVTEVIDENRKSVDDYFNGKDRALQFLVGQCMRKLKGRADANLLLDCIKKELEKRWVYEV